VFSDNHVISPSLTKPDNVSIDSEKEDTPQMRAERKNRHHMSQRKLGKLYNFEWEMSEDTM
jgi:hypothetical protein